MHQASCRSHHPPFASRPPPCTSNRNLPHPTALFLSSSPSWGGVVWGCTMASCTAFVCAMRATMQRGQRATPFCSQVISSFHASAPCDSFNLGTINSVTAVAELAATLGQGGHPLAMLGQLLTIEIRAQCPPICPAVDAVLWLHANGTSAPLQQFPGVPLVNERANITLQVLRERELSFLTDCRPVPFFSSQSNTSQSLASFPWDPTLWSGLPTTPPRQSLHLSP